MESCDEQKKDKSFDHAGGLASFVGLKTWLQTGFHDDWGWPIWSARLSAVLLSALVCLGLVALIYRFGRVHDGKKKD